jgi:hypothetical protein
VQRREQPRAAGAQDQDVGLQAFEHRVVSVLLLWA